MRQVTAAIIRDNGRYLICQRGTLEEMPLYEFMPADIGFVEELLKDKH